MKKSIYTLSLLLIFCASAYAQKRFNGSVSTDWNTNANWTPLNRPTAADNVIISSADYGANAPIITSANATCNNITISPGSSLTLNSNRNLSCNNLVVNTGGTLSTPSIGTAAFNSATATGLITVSGNIYNAGSLRVRRVTMSTNNSQVIGTGRFLIYFFNTASDVAITTKASMDSIGTLTQGDNRDCTIDSGYIQLAYLTSSNGQEEPKLIYGNANSRLILGSTAGRNPELRYSGDNYSSEAPFDRFPIQSSQFSGGQGTVWYNATTTDQAVVSNVTYYNLKTSVSNGRLCHVGISDINCTAFCAIITYTLSQVNVSNDLTVLSNSGSTTGQVALDANMVVGKNITISSSSTLDVLDNSFTLGAGDGNIFVAGDWTNNGTFIQRDRTVSFNGTSTQYIGGSSITSFYNLSLSKASSGETVISQGTVGSGEVRVGQSTAGGTGGNLSLGNDILRLNHRALRVYNQASTAIARNNGSIRSEETTTSGGTARLDGRVIWATSGVGLSYTFPFSSENGDYVPVNITDGGAGNLGTLTLATARWGLTGNISPYPATYDGSESVTKVNDITNTDNSANVLRRFWSLSKTGGGTANIIFTYADPGTNSNASGAREGNDEVPSGAAGGYEPANGLRAQRWINTADEWEYNTTASPFMGTQSSNSTNNTITVLGITNFSTIWAVTKLTAPLPVELLEFIGRKVKTGIQLHWKTASEYNNDHFELEKSITGLNFTKIYETKASGSAASISEYNYIDTRVLSDLSYYRIKQVDISGNFKYSKILQIDISTLQELHLRLFPNPVEDKMMISLNDVNPDNTYVATILNSEGSLVRQFSFDGSEKLIDLSRLNKGLYIFHVQSGSTLFTSRFLKL